MIGRPQTSEAADYYFTYVNCVQGDDVIRTLVIQLEETLTLASGISEDKSLYRYAPEKWSIRQVFNHLADTERAFSLRAYWFARGFDTSLPSFDQNVAIAGAKADRVSLAANVEDFRRVRLATISFYENMPEEAWMRSGVASDNRFTVRALAYIIAGHVEHHVKILKERYLQGAMAHRTAGQDSR